MDARDGDWGRARRRYRREGRTVGNCRWPRRTDCRPCRAWRRRPRRDSARLAIALHALEIGAQIRRALITQPAVFLQGLADDPFQSRRDIRRSAPIGAVGSRLRIASKMTADVVPSKMSVVRWPSRTAPHRTRTGPYGRRASRRAPARATCRPPFRAVVPVRRQRRRCRASSAPWNRSPRRRRAPTEKASPGRNRESWPDPAS